MEKPTEEYLQELISNARKKFDEFSNCFADIPNAKITYVNTQKRNLTGMTKGLRGLAEMKAHNTKESLKISPNSKNYNKFYKSGEKVIKVECFVGGHNDLDVVYVAQYDGERRYLFPFLRIRAKPSDIRFS